MAGAIGYKRDEIFIITLRPLPLFFVQYITYHPNQIDIFLFIISANVVLLACGTFIINSGKCFAVIAHVQPVPNIFSGSVHGNGFLFQGLSDNSWNELFIVLMRAIIIG